MRLAVAAVLAVLCAAPSASALELAPVEDGATLAVYRLGGDRVRPLRAAVGSGLPQWEPFGTLRSRGSGDPTLASAPSGAAAAAWFVEHANASPDVMASVRAPGGRFGTPQLLARGAYFGRQPAVAVNSRGDAVAAWYEGSPGDQTLIVSVRPAGGGFAPGERIAGTTDHDIAIEEDGSVLLVTQEPVGRDQELRVHLYARTRPPGGRFGAPALVSDPAESAVSHDLALASDGHALLAWRARRPDAVNAIRVAERPPGGGFGAPAAVSGDDGADPRAELGAPAVATAPGAAEAVVAWAAPDPERIRAVVRTGGGAFGPPQTVGSLGVGLVGTRPFRVAMDGAGNGAIAWRDSSGRLLGVYRTPGRAFGSVLELLPNPRNRALGHVRGLALAFRPNGRAVAAEEISDGEIVRELAVGFGTGPRPASELIARGRAYVREAPRSRCLPSGSRTLRQNSRARVYRRGGLTFGCLFDRGRPVELALGAEETIDGEPIDLTGPLVAYPVLYCGVEDCSSVVELVDLRGRFDGERRALTDRTVPDDHPPVPDVEVASNGAVAWIACPELTCAGRGLKRVWVADSTASDGVSRSIGRGRGIAPRSLTVSGSRVRWIDRGRMRSARIR
jgi:hypothetical protein